jgi:2-methylisocitrate lyase-like PEP mutase family enzyme
MKTFCEVHSGLSSLLVDKSKYDGMWVSSLTHSAIKGLPDNELVSLKERVDFVEEIRRITTKPIIVDVDTMGDIRHVPFYTRWFNKAGAYAIVIEDKKYPKENSLLMENNHQLEDVDKFCEKIKVAKSNAGEMKVIARLESLIAKHSMEEALIRAEAYVKAGADMILIHSKEVVNCLEVMDFSRRFRKISQIPLVAIPTTYFLPDEHNFEIVITANHLLRVSLKAMQKFLAGEEIEIASVQDLFDIVGH